MVAISIKNQLNLCSFIDSHEIAYQRTAPLQNNRCHRNRINYKRPVRTGNVGRSDGTDHGDGGCVCGNKMRCVLPLIRSESCQHCVDF